MKKVDSSGDRLVRSRLPCCLPLMIMVTIALVSGCNLPPISTIPSSTMIGTSTLTSIPSTPIPPTDTPLPASTTTPSVTPTQVWVFQSGTVTCPILLYHRIADPPLPNSIAAAYYTLPVDFEWQMQALKDWGYSTIPISSLVEAITTGILLPPRPVVITFDDGRESVFENAYPIMQSLGFTGVLYLIGDAVGSQDFMTLGQIQKMTGNGWEIGSHSMTHPYLTAVHDTMYLEGGESKGRLASEIGVSVLTFAYPYGAIDPYVVEKIAEYGYLAAVGLGTQYDHSLATLFYLSRIEVPNPTDPAGFARMLPWSGQP
jgi:peptidoglycan/xylan/chitin deacetylase (PgdA/CDA1 family)